MTTRKRARPLWTCPKCGHRFVTRNLWHSCGRYRLADHFLDTDPVVREVFDRFWTIARSCGPATRYAQKTRIVFQVRVRFASAMTRTHALDATLWLKRRVEHPWVRRVEVLPPGAFIHHFRLTDPAQLDEAFALLVREAYAAGRQERRPR
jgi:hypothetical protein